MTECGTGLLDEIRSIRTSVGDGLNDVEFTRLLCEYRLPDESGFRFLSFCGGNVTFVVPPQEMEDWYCGENGLNPEKDRLAKEIAAKHGLLLFEPPDLRCYVTTGNKSLNSHHHIELSDGDEVIVAAHPRYLKIKVYRDNARVPWVSATPACVSQWNSLLRDLAPLYQ